MSSPEFVLQTPRLTLRPLGDADVASLVRHWGDAEVRRYLWDDQPVSYDVVNQIVTTSNRDFESVAYGIWAIRLRGEDELIGVCGLRRVQQTDWTEILYSLRPRHWGKGFAHEAVQAVLGYAFRQLGLERVVASFDDGNVASARVLRRHGLSPFSGSDGQAGPYSYWQVTRDRYLARTVPPDPPRSDRSPPT